MSLFDIQPPGSAICFESCLRESIDNERRYEDIDLGPTDSLPQDTLDLHYQWFYGSSPLTSASTSPASSPHASRCSSPTPISFASTSRHPSSSASDPKQGNSKTRRNKKRGHDKRRGGHKGIRHNRRSEPYQARPPMTSRHARPENITETTYRTEDLETASSGYIGPLDEDGPMYSLEKFQSMGFKVVKCSGKRPMAFTDTSGRIIGVFANEPEDDGWEGVCRGATEAIRICRSKCRFSKKTKKHRRGNFPALSRGISFGGGQKRPGNLYHPSRNNRALAELAANENISRIVGFANGAFASWAPNLYTYCEDHFDRLLRDDDSLQRNFENSIWAAFAVNFGPKTVCRRHRDFANLPFSWCSITALGDFDPTKGGHLVLWDLKLLVEFPPGTTILIPSAAITHSNVPIGAHETRLSFTQYSAGGLFRWVDQGFQCAGMYSSNLTPEEQEEDQRKQAERCKLGLSLFSTLSSLESDLLARKHAT